MTRRTWYRAWRDARSAVRGYVDRHSLAEYRLSVYRVAERMIVGGWHHTGAPFGLALILLLTRERVKLLSPRRHVWLGGPADWPGLPPWESRGVTFQVGCQADPGLGPVYSRT